MRSSLLPLIALIIVMSVSTAFADTDTCPTGSVPITDATRNDATAAGIPTSSHCWNPSDANAGQAAGAAKEFLAQHATKNVNVACFNARFAEDLAALMKAVPGGPPTITDGYRSPANQEKARASGASQVGACRSYHQYGLAADFNNTNARTLLWMRMNAPQFGLTRIPALSVQTGCSLRGTGFCDPAHIQIAAALPPTNECGQCGGGASYPGTQPEYTGPSQSDDSRFNTPGDLDYMPYNAPQSAPTFSTPLGMPASFGSGFSSGLGMPSMTPATSPLSNPSTNPAVQPPTCTPSFSCQAGVMYYHTTSCSTQVYQVCPGACNGDSCAAASSTTNTTLNNAFTSSSTNVNNTNTNVNTNTDTPTATSVSDLLNAMANPFSVATIGTSSGNRLLFALNPDTGDVQSISTEAPTTSASSSETGVISSVQPTNGQQTFTSSDLTQSGVSGTFSSDRSRLAALLESMRQAVLWALDALKPFGGGTRH